MKFKHGLAFPDADEYLYDRLPESGVWQQDALDFGLKHCKNFRVAIDGGAHVGTWSLALSHHFEKVWAFEMAPDTFDALLKNVEDKENVVASKLALANINRLMIAPCQTKKDQDRKHTGARFIDYNTSKATTETVKIDHFNFDYVDFIKLDLEGGELDAIKGATETLLRCKPIMVIEDGKFNERFGYKKTDTSDYLMGLGANLLEKCGINYVWGWE